MKAVKAWMPVLDDGALCVRSNGVIDVFYDRKSGLELVKRLADFGVRLVRVEIREIKKKGTK